MAGGMAGFGLLAGHEVDYLLLPDELRAHVLTSTGHGDLAPALFAAGFGAIVTAVALIAGALARGRRGDALTILPTRALGTRLAFLGAGGFLALEIVERAASGSVGHHLTPRILLPGLLLQVAFAFATAWTTRLLRRAAHEFGSALAATVPHIDATAATIVVFLDPANLAGIEPLRRAAPRAPPPHPA